MRRRYAGPRGGIIPTLAATVRERRWAFELVFALVVAGAAALILTIVGRRSGWPIGQAFNNELILVRLYAAHFRHLDFFPVWSSSDGLGLGTPALVFYQKAFFYVAGALLILFGSLKPALVATLGIFLVVGAYGMRRALGLVTTSRLLVTVGSVGFLFTNYVFTDWLVRGDLPEFSAVMLVPWVLYWCLELVRHRRVSLVLIVVLPLLVDAHSAIGLISVFTLAAAMITFVTVAGWTGLRAIGPRLVVAVGGAALLLAPTLLAELRFATYYDPASKVTNNNNVTNDFVDFWSYFSNRSYRWLVNTAHLNLQIDFALWIPILVAGLGALTYWVLARKRPDRSPFFRPLDGPSMVFLLTSLAVYLLLQWRLFLGVYRFLTPLEVIDYPYRMLAFIVPLCIIVVVALADCLIRRYPMSPLPRLGAVAWLLSLVVLSPVTATWTTTYGLLAAHGQFPSVDLSAPPAIVDYRSFRGFFSFNGILYDEYLPKVFTKDGHELSGDGPLYSRLHAHDDGAAALGTGRCAVVVPSRVPLETLRLRFTVACRRPALVALPVTYNPFSTVWVVGSHGKWRHVPYVHSANDPRIIVRVTDAAPTTYVVDLPTLWGVLG
jgi:hypothetical protein